MSNVTETIASVCATSSISDLDGRIVEHAVRSLDRVLSIGVTKQRDPLIARIDRALGSHPGPTMIEGIGPSRRYVPSTATLTIASASALGNIGTAFSNQVSSAVVASAFVAAQLSDCSGEQLIVAIALGCEVAERIRLALGEAHVARGWDPVGTAGRIGATCATSTALGINMGQIHDALGFASTMAAGIRVAGGELAAIGAGKAAADALEAAMLAREGLIGPPEPIAGRRGLMALTAPEGIPDKIVEGFGQHWHDFAILEPLELEEVVEHLSNEPGCQSIVAAFHACIEREISG
ncbi:MAG TPA: MmgE/PrpD family protein [Acidimicrobiales bacterium]|nr:MmgE/PrpD family protein [Acidimicrobiales bacterium]